jgi:hypothetical protein
MGYQKQDQGCQNQDLFHGRSSVEAKAVCHRFAKSEEAAKKIVPGQ